MPLKFLTAIAVVVVAVLVRPRPIAYVLVPPPSLALLGPPSPVGVGRGDGLAGVGGLPVALGQLDGLAEAVPPLLVLRRPFLGRPSRLVGPRKDAYAVIALLPKGPRPQTVYVVRQATAVLPRLLVPTP